MPHPFARRAAVVLLVFATHCSKSDAPASPTEGAATELTAPSAAPSSTAPAVAPAPAATAAVAMDASAPPAAAASDSGTAAASTLALAPSATPASAKKAAGAPVDAGPTCGTKPLPDCPLQAWMKANTSSAMSSKDFAALETALRKTVAFAPPSGYPNWASISKDGAEAAKAQNLDAVKASCRGCHDQYKAKYRAELRARPMP